MWENENMPEKVTDIDILRIVHARGKKCYCRSPRFVMEEDTRTVYCRECGAQMDAYEALRRLANHWESVQSQVQQLRDQYTALQAYQPRRRVVKDLERRLTHKQYQHQIPTCPRCHEGFEVSELLTTPWVSRPPGPNAKEDPSKACQNAPDPGR